tara:strand:+ start:76 stop:336 length:261 start_codon:yes stop_codon:yes gene_type:complete
MPITKVLTVSIPGKTARQIMTPPTAHGQLRVPMAVKSTSRRKMKFTMEKYHKQASTSGVFKTTLIMVLRMILPMIIPMAETDFVLM